MTLRIKGTDVILWVSPVLSIEYIMYQSDLYMDSLDSFNFDFNNRLKFKLCFKHHKRISRVLFQGADRGQTYGIA